MTAVGAVGNKPVQTLEEYFGGASLLGSGADLAMVVFGLQIQQMEDDVVAEIRKIEDAGKVREAINDRMTQLRAVRDLIRGLDAEDKDDFVELKHLIEQMNAKGLDLGLLRQMDFNMNADGTLTKKLGKPLIGAENAFDKNGNPKPLRTQTTIHTVQASVLGTINSSPAGSTASATPGTVGMASTGANSAPTIAPSFESVARVVEIDNVEGTIRADSIDSEVKRLEGEAQKLDQNREIKMIMLNQQLNKKEQAVTQLTNIIKKSHDTRSAIINNLK